MAVLRMKIHLGIIELTVTKEILKNTNFSGYGRYQFLKKRFFLNF